MMPANDGAAADVPPTKYTDTYPWLSGTQEPSRQSRYGSWLAAVNETSGKSRTPSSAIPTTPDCHEGFGIPDVVPPLGVFPALAPPLLDQRPLVALLSFHT